MCRIKVIFCLLVSLQRRRSIHGNYLQFSANSFEYVEFKLYFLMQLRIVAFLQRDRQNWYFSLDISTSEFILMEVL